MTAPPVPPDVAAAFAALPEPVAARLLEVRALIFAVADETPGVGPLTETLKWGEPAYLTEATGSGSTIRLGREKGSDGTCAVFFNCRTSLVATFREIVPDAFRFGGDRALMFPAATPLPRAPLALCLRAALTYHAGRTARRRSAQSPRSAAESSGSSTAN